MVLRVVQFLLGAVLAGAGGWLAWTYRDGAANLFPPGPDGLPVLLLAGVAGVLAGIVFLVSALHPRPNQRRTLAEKTAREGAALTQAEAYYADRDWRSGDIPAPKPAPAPVPPPPVTIASAKAPPVAAAAAPPPAAPAPKAVPFPAAVTLEPIPRAAETPMPVAPLAPAETVAMPISGPFADIRSAIESGRLAEAGRMIGGAREGVVGVELAELIALAAQHAAASGQASEAKWLWKLSLKRFAEADAAESPSAKAVAESLRTAV